MIPAIVLFVAWFSLTIWMARKSHEDAGYAQAEFNLAARKLRLEASGAHAVGRIDVPLELTLLETLQVKVVAIIEPALDLGLAIRPRRGKLLIPDELLNPSFDAAFVVEAADRIQAIDLVKGEIARMLTQFEAGELAPSVLDGAVEFLVPRVSSSERIIAAAMAANDLAVQLLSRRPHLRTPSIERAFARALREVARTLGASVGTGRLEQSTPAGDLSVRIERARDGRHSTRFAFRFARRLPQAFELADERARSSLARLTDPDIQTGDADFDAAFVVRSEQPEKLDALLDPASKKALLELWRRVGSIRIDAAGIEARLPVVLANPKKLMGLVDALRAAGEALGRHAPASPYR